MRDLAAIRSISKLAWQHDPIDDFRQEAASVGPIAIMVMPDGSLHRLPVPEMPDLSHLKEEDHG